MTEKTFTRSEVVAELLQQHERHCAQRATETNARFDRLEGKVDSHFRWMVGIMVAVLLSVIGSGVAITVAMLGTV